MADTHEIAGHGVALTDLHAANIARQAEWCAVGDPEPDLAFRGNELAGETGEACNVIKKLERERHGWRGSRATKEQLAEELADVVICADLCAVTAGIDLDAAVRAKFNATSEKVGLTTMLAAPPAKGGTEDEIDLADERPLAEQAANHGRDWRLWWHGSGPERGDHIMELRQGGQGDKSEIAYLGDQHHDAATAIVNEHNEQVRRLREVIARKGAAKMLLQKEIAELRASPTPPAGAAGGGSSDLAALSADEVRIAMNTDAEARIARLEVSLPFDVSKWLTTICAHALGLYDASTDPCVRDLAVAIKACAADLGEAFSARLIQAPAPDIGAQGEPVAAREALARMKAREGESVDQWASRLAPDLAAAGEAEYDAATQGEPVAWASMIAALKDKIKEAEWHEYGRLQLSDFIVEQKDRLLSALEGTDSPSAYAFEANGPLGWQAAASPHKPSEACHRNIRPLYDRPAPAAPRSGSGVTVEEIAEIKDALIQARGALHLDAMTDEAGKHYGTTTVAQEAIEKALALLQASRPGETGDGLSWAVSRWQAEVANRPLSNVHRRTLDTTWRQVIRHSGGDPDALVGPDHDTRLYAIPQIEMEDGR